MVGKMASQVRLEETENEIGRLEEKEKEIERLKEIEKEISWFLPM